MCVRFPHTVENLWEITVYATTDKIMNAWDQIKRRLEENDQPGCFSQLGNAHHLSESAMATRSLSPLPTKRRVVYGVRVCRRGVMRRSGI